MSILVRINWRLLKKDRKGNGKEGENERKKKRERDDNGKKENGRGLYMCKKENDTLMSNS